MKIRLVLVLLLLARGELFGQTGRGGVVRIGTLIFEANVSVTGSGAERMLRTVVRVTNRGRDTVQLTSAGDCPVALRVARQFGGAAVWDGVQHRGLCYEVERLVRLAPTRSAEFVQTDSLRRLSLGGGQSGPYFFTAVLRIGGGVLQVLAGHADLSQ